MNEATVTFQGWVGNEVVHRDTGQGSVAHFRVGSTPRYRKRGTGDWVDGETSWFSVTCWRGLADHVRDSIRKGEPVVVHGRLRTDVWERDGHSTVSYVVEATYVGHDLSRGTAVFTKAARPDRAEEEDDSQQVVREILHDSPTDLPQLDSMGRLRSPSRVA